MAHGHKTGGGTRKGRPNKYPKTFRDQLWAYCAQLGVNPHHYLADLLADTSEVAIGVDPEGRPIMAPAVSVQLKFQAAKELAQYLAPKLRSVELTGDVDKPVQVAVATSLVQALQRAYGAA